MERYEELDKRATVNTDTVMPPRSVDLPFQEYGEILAVLGITDSNGLRL